jgi:hypothetical protein
MWFTRVPEMQLMTPMLGAGLDWLEAVLPLIFVFIWIVSQVAAVFRKLNEKKPVRLPPRPEVRPPEAPKGAAVEPIRRPPQPAAAPQGGLEADLRQQIEAFLKERSPEIIPIEPARAPAVPVASTPRKKPAKPRPPKQPAMVAVSRREGMSGLTGTDMPHLTSSLLRTARDEEPVPPPAASVAVAGTIAALLADPRSLRQAIVLREVLDRPVERW